MEKQSRPVHWGDAKSGPWAEAKARAHRQQQKFNVAGELPRKNSAAKPLFDHWAGAAKIHSTGVFGLQYRHHFAHVPN